jgi:hypothetical protein
MRALNRWESCLIFFVSPKNCRYDSQLPFLSIIIYQFILLIVVFIVSSLGNHKSHNQVAYPRSLPFYLAQRSKPMRRPLFYILFTASRWLFIMVQSYYDKSSYNQDLSSDYVSTFKHPLLLVKLWRWTYFQVNPFPYNIHWSNFYARSTTLLANLVWTLP